MAEYKKRDELIVENEKFEKENNELKARLDKMEELMSKLLEEKTVASEESVVENIPEEIVQPEYDLTPIPPNQYIRVTSLCSGKLNLTPRAHGKGNPVTFYGFGQTRNVTYQTLEEIVSANRKMAENGRYYIQNEKAVRLLMLEDTYENILDEKSILAIVENKNSDVLELFKMTPKKQQDHVVAMIVKRVLDGHSIDYNQLNAISQIYGKDLIMRISEAKSMKQAK